MKTIIAILFTVAMAGSLLVACDDSTAPNGQPDLSMEEKPDLSGSPDGGVTCVTNPMTHVEIINACTNADSYDKMPFYPTLAPNGTLPALP
jgi:hypothetical protein